MNENTVQNHRTQQLLIRHYHAHPRLEAEDIFKFLFQSAYGCEHLVSDADTALRYIKQEYDTTDKTEPLRIEPLDGVYSRVFLSCLNSGLKPETLAKLFCLSAKKEPDGREQLEQKIKIAQSLIANGSLPLERERFAQSLSQWRAMDFPAIRHSATFRSEYRPAYRVVANHYAELVPLLAEIDTLSCQGSVILAIDGCCASGKTTLAATLAEIYQCTVFHMDDFFLRPEQRTPERLAEAGGNVDRERFFREVLIPLSKRTPVTYQRFDCAAQALCPPITLSPTHLTVIEGSYAMHPLLSPFYTLSVFLDVDRETQRKRIQNRNSELLAKRFFDEWIPLENKYFSELQIKEKCTMQLTLANRKKG